MPRKSAADLNVVPLHKNREVLKPLATLKPAEMAVFNNIGLNNLHLGKLDIPLIEAYAIINVRLSAKGRTMKMGDLDKATRLLMTLATKLRLTPQSRIDPEKLSRRVVNNKYEWQGNDAEAETEENNAEDEA